MKAIVYELILDPEALLTTKQCARLRGCSVNTLRRERRERRGIPFVEFNMNSVRYRRGDVLDYINRYRVEVDAPRPNKRPAELIHTK